MDSKITPLQADIEQLKRAQEQLDNEYSDRNRELTEQALQLLKQTMVHYGLDEVMLYNFKPNGDRHSCWDFDDDEDENSIELPEYTLNETSFGKPEEGYREKKIPTLTRFGLKDREVVCHMAITTVTDEGDFDIADLGTDLWQAPWIPVLELKEQRKLQNLIIKCVSHSGNWEYTKSHPESCFLHRKLTPEMIEDKIREASGSDDMAGLFNDWMGLKHLNLSDLDTSKAETVQAMFYDCENLREINLSGLDFSNCNKFESMFDGCKRLQQIDFGDINTSNAENLQEMFRKCQSLVSLDLSMFNIEKVTNLYCIFEDCDSLETLNLSGWKIKPNTTNCGYMFSGCSKLSRIYLRDSDETTYETIKNYAPDTVEIITK